MNGILCMDKPQGFTSFDVVAKMRGIARTRKIGHGGTLDPMATGVLPLFLGTATKACDLLPVQDKRYTATFRLGLTTDTLDITGTVLEQRPVGVGVEQVRAALAEFEGKISQLPPMYSAVQVNGKRLYDLARQGVEVERKPREVEFYHITLTAWDEETATYTVDAACSKGTYIRSLCHDVGKRLGCGAVLTGLRRTQAAGFTLDQCITLDQAQELRGREALESALLPVEQAFSTLPRLVLEPKLARLVQNGVRLETHRANLPDQSPGPVAAFTQAGLFLGLVKAEEGKVKIVKLFEREAVE